MKKRGFRLATLALMGIVLAACTPAPEGGPEVVETVIEELISTPTPTPAPTATPTPQRLVMEPFAPPGFQGDLSTIAWADEEGFHLRVPYQGNVANPVFGFTTTSPYTNFEYEVLFELLAGSARASGLAGPASTALFLGEGDALCIAFGFEDNNNFFKFGFSVAQGQVTPFLARFDNGQFSFLSQPGPVAGINANADVYLLWGTVQDGRFSGYIDETLFIEQNLPSDYSGGAVGPCAFTYGEGRQVNADIPYGNIRFNYQP